MAAVRLNNGAIIVRIDPKFRREPMSSAVSISCPSLKVRAPQFYLLPEYKINIFDF